MALKGELTKGPAGAGPLRQKRGQTGVFMIHYPVPAQTAEIFFTQPEESAGRGVGRQNGPVGNGEQHRIHAMLKKGPVTHLAGL